MQMRMMTQGLVRRMHYRQKADVSTKVSRVSRYSEQGLDRKGSPLIIVNTISNRKLCKRSRLGVDLLSLPHRCLQRWNREPPKGCIYTLH